MTNKLNFHNFWGTENYYRVSFLPYVLTDGVAYAVQALAAFWLTDAIASHLVETEEEFVVARLRKEGEGAVLTLDDGGKGHGTTLVARQHIAYADFDFDRWPELEVKFFCSRSAPEIGWVIMLPQEY